MKQNYYGNLSFGLIAFSSLLIFLLFAAGTYFGGFYTDGNPMKRNIFEAGAFFYILFGLGLLLSLLQSVGVVDTFYIFRGLNGRLYAKKSGDITDTIMGHVIMPLLTKFLIMPFIYAAVIYYILYIVLSVALAALPYIAVGLAVCILVFFLVRLWKSTRISSVGTTSMIGQMGSATAVVAGLGAAIAGYIAEYANDILAMWQAVEGFGFGGVYRITENLSNTTDMDLMTVSDKTWGFLYSAGSVIPNILMAVGFFILACRYSKFKTPFYILAIPLCIIAGLSVIFNSYTQLHLNSAASTLIYSFSSIAVKIGWACFILRLCCGIDKNIKIYTWGCFIAGAAAAFFSGLYYHAVSFKGLMELSIDSMAITNMIDDNMWLIGSLDTLRTIALPLSILFAVMAIIAVPLFLLQIKKAGYPANRSMPAKLMFFVLILMFLNNISGLNSQIVHFITTTLTIFSLVKFGSFLQEKDNLQGGQDLETD